VPCEPHPVDQHLTGARQVGGVLHDSVHALPAHTTQYLVSLAVDDAARRRRPPKVRAVPQCGPVRVKQVEQLLAAKRRFPVCRIIVNEENARAIGPVICLWSRAITGSASLLVDTTERGTTRARSCPLIP